MQTKTKSLTKVLLKSEVSWVTYLLVCIFGIGSWVALNGLWVELPLLVDRVPEKWNLPSYLVIITQLANLGPLAYSVGNRLAPRVVTEKPAIFTIVFIGATSCVLLSLFWDKNSVLFGVEHSTALLFLSFCLAIVDCTSSVVFLTFMATFPSQYISALFVGETLSGMLPGLLALGQGIGSHQCSINNTGKSNDTRTTSKKTSNFGPSLFFLFLFGMMVLCGLAFLGLNFLSVTKKQHVNVKKLRQRAATVCSEEESQTLLHGDSYVTKSILSAEPQQSSLSHCRYTWRQFVYLLVLQAWINCLMNGVIPSIQAYACKPYGSETYHLVATLTNIASALTCFIALWVPSRSIVKVTVLSIIYTCLSAYILTLASMSPTPPLYNSQSGSVIVVSVSIISGCLINYSKLTICTMMREIGQRALFWCGIAIQVGSFIGAVTMFPLVNVANLFHQSNPKC